MKKLNMKTKLSIVLMIGGAICCFPPIYADAKKGEQIILFTSPKKATLSELIAASPGVSNINFPKKILIVESIPVMATGKTDYPAVTALTNI